MKEKFIKIIKISLLPLSFFVLFATGVNFALSATLSVLPSASTVSVGQNISLNLEVGSSESVNAISGKINYNKELLKVTSINKTNSIINFWTQEPDYTSLLGEVEIEGVILNPGFTGQKGRVVTINFMAIKEGSAIFSLKNANVLANDGVGTSVQTTTGVAKLNITKEIPKENLPKTETDNLPKSNNEMPAPDSDIDENVSVEINNPEILDYPIEVGAGKSFVVKGKGGQEPISIYAVKIKKNRFFGSSVTYYRDITSLSPDYSKKAIVKNGEFSAEFKIDSGGGRYGFYAKDQIGGVSSVVFVDINRSFWLDLKNFCSEYWWIGLVIMAFIVSNYISWKIGKRSA